MITYAYCHVSSMLMQDDTEAKRVEAKEFMVNLARELGNLERLTREYVAATKCSCPPAGPSGVPALNCWHCVFRFNLDHVDALVEQGAPNVR